MLLTDVDSYKLMYISHTPESTKGSMYNGKKATGDPAGRGARRHDGALGHRTPRHSLGDTPRRVKEEKMHEDRRACPARPPRGEGFREYTDNRRADTVQGRDASRHA